MRYLLPFTIVLIFLMFLVSGCQKDTTPVGASLTGTLTIYLTDAPIVAGFDSVNITFGQVSAHLDSEWVTVQADTTVNLLELSNGNTIIFGSAQVPVGKYTQIRIKIDDAYVVLDGQEEDPIPMSVPSGAQTGLKFGPQFTVEEGGTYELAVDFDVSRSVVVSPQGYTLKPYIRVIVVEISGSISGTVSNPDQLPIAYAIQNSDTVTSTIVSPIDGYFKLSFLPAGIFTVSIRDTMGRTATMNSVLVASGSDKHSGEVELQSEKHSGEVELQ